MNHSEMTNRQHLLAYAWRLWLTSEKGSHPLVGLQSLPLHEPELLLLLTEAGPNGSLLLGAADVRLPPRRKHVRDKFKHVE